MSNLRNSQLLQQMQAHPLKSTLAKALDIAEEFKDAIEAVSDNRKLSAEGKQEATQGHLRRAIRDLRDAKIPLNELQTKLDAKRKAVAMPKFDPADVVGFLRRQELRAGLKSATNTGERTLLLEDDAFADALLEQPAALSGLHPLHGEGEAKDNGNQDFVLVEAVKKRRLETLFAPQLAEIAELEGTIAEAAQIVNIARNDLQLHSGIDDRRVFEEFAKPIELKTATHWLRKDADGTIRVIDLENHRARVATEREILDGKYYRDIEEYRADRAAA
jgi:hypothetical protein